MGTAAERTRLPSPATDHAPAGAWQVFWATPLRMRSYLGIVAIAATSLPFAMNSAVATPYASEGLTVTALIAFSALNVEISRWISGGLARTQQPHKALSAWTFAAALLLPTPWLPIVVVVTYAHARWRGIRVPLWKWIGSGLYLVLCGVAAAGIRAWSMGSSANWMDHDGVRGLLTMLVAGLAFLALEALLFAGSALLNEAEDEVWLRAMLTDRSFYVTEGGVLFIGGLWAAVWAAGPWFTLFFVPIYVLIQHAVLVAPLRERAASAHELAQKNSALATANAALEEKNRELKAVNQFKTDLMSMLGHEIGNPLTAVRGYAQLGVEARGDAEETHLALVKIDRNATQMATVLSDIVHLVASERGVLFASPERVRLAPHLAEAVAGLGSNPLPAIECPAELEVAVQPGHLDQMLGNLLSNAAKYAGGATLLRARLTPDSWVEIVVTDAGPGIPHAFADRLFNRHERDPETADRIAGTGLGLFISRELARANGGDLTHTATTRGGATFVIRLPAHDPQPTASR